MPEINFPKRNDDQSFTVFAQFTTSDPAVPNLVQDYVKVWTRVNSNWTRIWRSNVIREESLDFYSEFQAEPRVEHGIGETSFSVVLEGRPTATRWKDWAVFLIDDILRVFHEVKFEQFEQRQP
jgi:hypothetical protein